MQCVLGRGHRLNPEEDDHPPPPPPPPPPPSMNHPPQTPPSSPFPVLCHPLSTIRSPLHFPSPRRRDGGCGRTPTSVESGPATRVNEACRCHFPWHARRAFNSNTTCTSSTPCYHLHHPPTLRVRACGNRGHQNMDSTVHSAQWQPPSPHNLSVPPTTHSSPQFPVRSQWCQRLTIFNHSGPRS